MDGQRQIVLSIDQGTTNTKCVLVTATGDRVATGSAFAGVTSPRPGWVEQDAEHIWASVLAATAEALAAAGPQHAVAAVALSTQRESVVAWRASTGEPVGPVIGWQDSRSAGWCRANLDQASDDEVVLRTGLRVDAMFSAPKVRWVLDHLPVGVPVADVRVGTMESWLVWRLSGGRDHLAEAGNASRTLLYDIARLAWSEPLLDVFGIPRSVLPDVRASDDGFGTCLGVRGIPDGTPVSAVLADSHAALFGQSCTEPGMAKATYGTGASVMTPVAALPTASSAVPTTLAWLVEGRPTYALEGNILSCGSTLAWTAGLLTGGRVDRLVDLAATVRDAGGVTLVPAFTGLGAPHWNRDAAASITGFTMGATAAHVARAALESVSHQVADVVDVIEAQAGPLRTFRADGGVTASELVMQDQSDLLDRVVEVLDVADVSALGAARLAWRTLGRADAWESPPVRRRYTPQHTQPARQRRRAQWTAEVGRACAPTSPTSPGEDPPADAASDDRTT